MHRKPDLLAVSPNRGKGHFLLVTRCWELGVAEVFSGSKKTSKTQAATACPSSRPWWSCHFEVSWCCSLISSLISIASAFHAGRRGQMADDTYQLHPFSYEELPGSPALWIPLHIINQNYVMLPLLAVHKTEKCSCFGWVSCHPGHNWNSGGKYFERSCVSVVFNGTQDE